MIRIALDTDEPDKLDPGIVARAQFLLTYSDIVPDLPALQARHPGTTVLLIDRGLGDPGMRATLADVETGALKPAQLPAWLDERKPHPYLTVYNDRANIPAVIEALDSRSCWHWIATLDGSVYVQGWAPLAGPALVQITPSDKLGFHADLSLVLNPAWHPAPVKPPISGAVAADLSVLHGINDQLAVAVQRLAADLG